MNPTIRLRLRILFFLEYLIKGSWFPLLGLYMGNRYLKFTGFQQAWVFNAFAIATVTGMFLGGQLADRHIVARRSWRPATRSAAWRCSGWSMRRRSGRSSG